MRLATTHVPISSWPAWTWNESGGSPPSIRVLSTARAFTPEPPVTVALITSTFGYRAVYLAIRASRAGPSSPAHQEKISSFSCAWTAAAQNSAAQARTMTDNLLNFMGSSYFRLLYHGARGGDSAARAPR